MKNIKLMLIGGVLVLTAVSCSNDDIDKGNSIFPTKTGEHQNDFDCFCHITFVFCVLFRVLRFVSAKVAWQNLI